MLRKLRQKIAEFIVPEYVQELADLTKQVDDIEEKVNQRIAKVVLDLDPFEPLMKQYHGVFGKDYERVEDRMDARGQLGMKMWGYQQAKDPYFEFITQWIMNTQGNAMLKAPARSNEERGEVLLWGKAQISSMILFIKEVGRLASLYEEELAKNRAVEFEESSAVES